MAAPEESTVIRDAQTDDHEAICALNLAAVEHTSPMDASRLAVLAELSCYHRVACVAGAVSAFVLAMSNEARYENENFSWFARRYPRFLYVDRIVVSAACRGRHVGSLLYQDVFRYARAHAIPLVSCEYYIVPPNEPSRSFHAQFGFREQGTQWIGDGTKRVSLQVAPT